MGKNTEQKIRFSRTKNTIRNILAGTVNRIILIFLPFVLKTLLIKKIGIEYAGLNGLFSSILQVLNLSELGFSSAVVYSMYKPIAENNMDMICALLNFYRKAYLFIGLFILAIGSILLPFLPKLIKGNIPPDINIYILYSIFLVNTSLSYLMFGYKNSLLNAHQRRDIISNIMTITQGLMYIVQIIILLRTRNYYAYILIMPIFTIINNIVVGIETKNRYPQYSCKGTLCKKIKTDIKKKVSGLMISKLAQTSRNSLDNIFISAFLGLTTTAIYSNYFLIFSSLTSFLNIITNSMQAGIGNSIQTESIDKNYKDLKKITLLYTTLIGWCSVCMLCIYQPFMLLWMGKEFTLPFEIVIMLCLYFYVLKSGDINSTYYNALGIWWQGKSRAITEAALNLVGNLLLVKYFGLYGIILTTIITSVLGHFWTGLFLFKLYFKDKIAYKYFLFELSLATVNIGIGFTIFFICHFIKIENPALNFFLTMIVCSISALFLFSGVYFFISKKLKLKFSVQKNSKYPYPSH